MWLSINEPRAEGRRGHFRFASVPLAEAFFASSFSLNRAAKRTSAEATAGFFRPPASRESPSDAVALSDCFCGGEFIPSENRMRRHSIFSWYEIGSLIPNGDADLW